jgi:hypothetical protein
MTSCRRSTIQARCGSLPKIDVVATLLLVAPRHAGVRTVRVADDERGVLLDVSRKPEYMPRGSFAKLQHELSIGE